MISTLISIGLFIGCLLSDAKPSIDVMFITAGVYAVAGAISYLGSKIGSAKK